MHWPFGRAGPTKKGVKGPAKVPVKAPTAQEFTAGAVNKAVLSQTIQHPATLLPIGVGVAALAWSVLMGPSEVSMLASLFGVFGGSSAWVVNYFFRGPTLAVRHIEGLRARRKQADIDSVEELGNTCEAAGFEEGKACADSLTKAYVKLLAIFDDQVKAGDELAVVQFKPAAIEAYREGMHLLQQASELYVALGTVDVGALQRELKSWRMSLLNLNGQEGKKKTREIQSFEERIAANQTRLDDHAAGEEKLQSFLDNVKEIEAVYESTQLQLSQQGNVELAAVEQKGTAASALKSALQAAKRVDEKMRGGMVSSAEDDRYLEEGEQTSPTQQG